MKRLSALFVVAAMSLSVPTAEASGIIINSIKSHVEARPPRPHQDGRSATERMVGEAGEQAQPVQNLLRWLQTLLESVGSE